MATWAKLASLNTMVHMAAIYMKCDQKTAARELKKAKAELKTSHRRRIARDAFVTAATACGAEAREVSVGVVFRPSWRDSAGTVHPPLIHQTGLRDVYLAPRPDPSLDQPELKMVA